MGIAVPVAPDVKNDWQPFVPSMAIMTSLLKTNDVTGISTESGRYSTTPIIGVAGTGGGGGGGGGGGSRGRPVPATRRMMW